jgi:hypothetical protein
VLEGNAFSLSYVYTDLRWMASGWTIFNNKGKPAKKYEPFFDDTYEFRFGEKVGVSPILFYDPIEGVVAKNQFTLAVCSSDVAKFR